MTSENEKLPQFQNPYAPPASNLETVTAGDSEEQHLRAFVGSKADYYLGKWRPLLTGRGSNTGFNWAAFLISGFWFPYRKMYRVATLFFAIILVESIGEEVIFVGFLGYDETPGGLDRIFGLVTSILCGVYGNRWYLSHAKKAISEVCGQEVDEHAIAEKLTKRGGTSLGSALGFFILFLVVMFAVFFVLDFVLYSRIEALGPLSSP